MFWNLVSCDGYEIYEHAYKWPDKVEISVYCKSVINENGYQVVFCSRRPGKHGTWTKHPGKGFYTRTLDRIYANINQASIAAAVVANHEGFLRIESIWKTHSRRPRVPNDPHYMGPIGSPGGGQKIFY